MLLARRAPIVGEYEVKEEVVEPSTKPNNVIQDDTKKGSQQKSVTKIKTGMNIIFETFKAGDEDGFEGINAEKLLEVFNEMGEEAATLDQCREYIKKGDTDGSGRVELEEFLHLFLLHIDISNDTEQDILEAFEALDPLCTGFLPADTLRELLTNLGDPFSQLEINEFISKGDLDRDGWVNYEALTKMLFDAERKYFEDRLPNDDNLPESSL